MAVQPPPVPAQLVGNAFVQQYYQILHKSPEHVYKFYQDISKLGRPEEDGTMTITSTMNGINDKILSLNNADYHAEISTVDAQDSFEGGVHVLVTGYLTGKDSSVQNFVHTFFLAPQEKGYFVLNDMIRYFQDGTIHTAKQAAASKEVASVTPEPYLADHLPVVDNQTPEQSTLCTERTDGGEVYNPPENGDVPVIVEEVPIPEVVDDIHNDSHVVVESNTKVEVASKKSYASIVKHLTESAATFSQPPPASRKPVPKSQDQVNQPSASGNDGQISNVDAADNVKSQNGEADGYSIYIKGLPSNTNYDMLHEEFKKFGPIKDGGIQFRNNRGFVFGFVEFEVASAVEKAIEASPIVIGGRQAVVEEKKSTYSRGNNRGRFMPGRNSGFRNEGMRGRGSYGGVRGYSRNDFGSRNGNHSSSSNRGDGYQRADVPSNSSGHTNRLAGMVDRSEKHMAPRVSAPA